MNRILVFGCPGSGKADMAARLGSITGYEVYHIEDDTLYKKYTDDKKESWLKAVENITSRDKWIIEGSQMITYSMRISRADTVIFINKNIFMCLINYIKRSFVKEDIKFSWGKIVKILTFKRKIKPYIEELIDKNLSHLMIYRINSDTEADEFIDDVRFKFYETHSSC